MISTPHKIRTFTVWLAVTTKYQGNGFAAEVLLGCDHPRVVPIGPIVRGVIASCSKNGNKTAKINVKNFLGSLTTVVRAQNDTSKAANITYNIFDRTLV